MMSSGVKWAAVFICLIHSTRYNINFTIVDERNVTLERVLGCGCVCAFAALVWLLVCVCQTVSLKGAAVRGSVCALVALVWSRARM